MSFKTNKMGKRVVELSQWQQLLHSSLGTICDGSLLSAGGATMAIFLFSAYRKNISSVLNQNPYVYFWSFQRSTLMIKLYYLLHFKT